MFNGDTEKVSIVEVSSTEAFRMLDAGYVDVLSGIRRVSSEDLKERSTGTGYHFSQPTFYDGLMFGGKPA